MHSDAAETLVDRYGRPRERGFQDVCATSRRRPAGNSMRASPHGTANTTSDADFENCPVCGTDLNEVPSDALLNKDVKEALRLCGEADADAAKGAEEWERDAAREFLEKLPESLQAFANNAPTTELLQIYRKAFVDELLAEPQLRWRLATDDSKMRRQCGNLRFQNIRYPLRLNWNIQRGRKSSRTGRWQNGPRISNG